MSFLLFICCLVRREMIHPDDPKPENERIDQKSEGIRVIEVEVFGSFEIDEHEGDHSENIEYMNRQNSTREEPPFILLVTRISKNEHGKQTKQRDGIAVGTDPYPCSPVQSDHLHVDILQTFKRIVAK